ncbi:MAG: BlaI/MecI/CopY family transcriptional regulator [Terriglobia bacterium]
MARRRAGRGFTPLELEMMKVLWSAGPSTVVAVRERLPGRLRLAYTTVQTMLNVLDRKGKVKRTLKGRAFEYTPVVSRKKAIRAAMRDLIDRLFGGSPETLVMSLVESRHLTPEKLARLTRLARQASEVSGPSPRKEAPHGDS